MDFNIAYFATVGQSFGGVEQKIIAQFDALLKQRTVVHLYLVCTFPPTGIFAIEINKRSNVKVLINTRTKVKNPFFRRKEKFQLISKELKNYNPKNTIVYFRYPGADFLFLKFLKSNRAYKVVTEHNCQIGNTTKKYKFCGNSIEIMLEILYGKRVRKRIYGFVGVTPEFIDFEVTVNGLANERKILMGNGVDVQKYPVRKLNNEHPKTIKLLFVGSGYRTHGIDRILKGMAIYLNSGKPYYKIVLRVAGESPEMKKNEALAKKLAIKEYVDFLGDKTPDDLNDHFNWADIGVGCLGVHRNGLKYSSALKVGEYLSRGIPFFDSSQDVDLPENFKYVYRVEANENPIDINELIIFVLQVRADLDHPIIMHNFATAHLDWKFKMKKLFHFFESIVDESS